MTAPLASPIFRFSIDRSFAMTAPLATPIVQFSIRRSFAMIAALATHIFQFSIFNFQFLTTYAEAITFSSTAIGVGNESTPTVVRVGWMVPKYSAYTWLKRAKSRCMSVR